jgi:hypothetical protein
MVTNGPTNSYTFPMQRNIKNTTNQIKPWLNIGASNPFSFHLIHITKETTTRYITSADRSTNKIVQHHKPFHTTKGHLWLSVFTVVFSISHTFSGCCPGGLDLLLILQLYGGWLLFVQPLLLVPLWVVPREHKKTMTWTSTCAWALTWTWTSTN